MIKYPNTLDLDETSCEYQFMYSCSYFYEVQHVFVHSYCAIQHFRKKETHKGITVLVSAKDVYSSDKENKYYGHMHVFIRKKGNHVYV